MKKETKIIVGALGATFVAVSIGVYIVQQRKAKALAGSSVAISVTSAGPVSVAGGQVVSFELPSDADGWTQLMIDGIDVTPASVFSSTAMSKASIPIVAGQSPLTAHEGHDVVATWATGGGSALTTGKFTVIVA